RMAASNEKRVRVEFFSKIIASVRSRAGASGSTRPLGQPARAFLRAWASSRMARRSAASSFQRSTKCLTGSVMSWVPSRRRPPRRRRGERGDMKRASGRRLGLLAGGLASAFELLDGLAGLLEGEDQRRQKAHAV